jgi:inorganic pyrophosphatase/exopolyphosphatase
LNSYLEQSKHELLSGASDTSPVTLVMGSTAADLDSIAGSISYGYLLARERSLGGLCCPYLPISRSELSLRREALALFERVGLILDGLLVAGDLDLADRLVSGGGELVLVDDQGAGLGPELQGRIVEVIDHHLPLPGRTAARAGAQSGIRRRIMEPVGSACTLVAEQVLLRKPEILDRQLSTLLLGAILLDTADLDPAAGRATEKDREIAGQLVRIGSASGKDLYLSLDRARRDVRSLNGSQLLGRDYKERRAGALRVGMSSVPLLLDSWQRGKKGLVEAASCFLTERELDLLVVLLYGTEQRFRRQIVFCALDQGLLERVISPLAQPLALAQKTAPPGGTDAQSPGHRPRVCIFHQGAPGESRKSIETRLLDILGNP